MLLSVVVHFSCQVEKRQSESDASQEMQQAKVWQSMERHSAQKDTAGQVCKKSKHHQGSIINCQGFLALAEGGLLDVAVLEYS